MHCTHTRRIESVAIEFGLPIRIGELSSSSERQDSRSQPTMQKLYMLFVFHERQNCISDGIVMTLCRFLTQKEAAIMIVDA